MEILYSSADFSIGIFITIGILIFRFIIKQSQKKNKKEKAVSRPVVSDYSSTSEDAIAQMLGEYKSQDSLNYDYEEENEELDEELELKEEVEPEDNFKRDTHYRIKKKKRSTGAILIDSGEELRRAVILQEILSPPLSQRKK